jgi:hypothetical protein
MLNGAGSFAAHPRVECPCLRTSPFFGDLLLVDDHGGSAIGVPEQVLGRFDIDLVLPKRRVPG